MPSKGRWALNPRKWFGAITHNGHKREKNATITHPGSPPLPPPSITKATPIPSAVPRVLPGRNQTKIMPTSSTGPNKNPHPMHTESSFIQFQLPAFNPRREPISTLLTSSKCVRRTPISIPKRTEPSIRKAGQFHEELSIDTTRWATPITAYDSSKYRRSPSPSSQSGDFPEENDLHEQMRMNISNLSNQCLIGYPQSSLNNLLEKDSTSSRTRSSSSIDDAQESSSSGIFTDDRADWHRRTTSKDTLSNLEVLSIESIADSQTSLNNCSSRPMIHHYRSPVSTYDTVETKSRLQRSTLLFRTQRSQSAEGLLKDTRIPTPILTRSRQSSAAIVKKIEKRLPTSRSPSATLEKSGFVRVATDTYRLTSDKDNHLYRRRQTSVIQSVDYDDSLPPAQDEESYARLPRASSTEHLNNDIQNDLRAIVDGYLRPMMNVKSKPMIRVTKTHFPSKRSHTTHEQTPMKLDIITDKLLSSIDCSAYSQYERYC